MAVPASQKAIRGIAMRQGLLFGGIIGVLVFLGIVGPALLSLLHPYYEEMPFFGIWGLFGLAPLLACVTFFIAGLRTAKKTGRVEMGALAGFWAAISVSALGLIAAILQTIINLEKPFGGWRDSMYWNMSLDALSATCAYLIVALLLGTAIGVLGGFIGKAYANDVPPIQAMPPLYMYPPTQPTEPPPMPPQNHG